MSTADRADSTSRSMATPASIKVQDSHRDRLAVVYVRQSTPKQVLDYYSVRCVNPSGGFAHLTWHEDLHA